jgi:hypothetical protein
MNQQELDHLLIKNEARIREIEERYRIKSSEIPTYKDELNKEKDTFKTRQKYMDNSLAYPTYGRGMTPSREMNTFMIQPNLAGSPEARRREAGQEAGSP